MKNISKNLQMFNQVYKETNVIFGGRLAQYKYYDMHHVIEQALNAVKKEFKEV